MRIHPAPPLEPRTQPRDEPLNRGRSNRPDVRNPILCLPSVARLRALPDATRQNLCAVLLDLRQDAQVRAEDCWRRHKAPMAAYWKAVAVYAGHLSRVLR